MPGQRIGDRERDHDRRHEGAGGCKDAEARIGGEEYQQRPEIEHELEGRIELGLAGHAA
jgi:hypothetical protein